MSCSHPLRAFIVGYTSEGKKILKFDTGKHDVYVDSDHLSHDVIEIPCGQCLGCRLQYSRQWADRCMMELRYHDSAYFVTLTYSDDYLNGEDQIGKTRRYYADPETGEAKVSLSLYPRDLQLFWKRLRKTFQDDNIRYYACGEYGDNTKRPHYHAIIFGLHLDDLKVYKTSGLKDVYYNSDKLQSVWPAGHAVIGEVTWETCAYVARYVMKKAKGISSKSYAAFNMDPEFVVMSRRPGIGKKYYDEFKDDFLNFGECYIGTKSGSVNCKTPRYFKNFLDMEFHEEFQIEKEREIQKAKDTQKVKLEMTDLCIEDLREVEEAALKMRAKALKREL